MPQINQDIQLAIDKLWKWFPSASGRLAEAERDPEAISKLDSLIERIHPEITWEIGPGLTTDWQFTVSPDLNRDLLSLTKTVVSRGPVVPGWEFYPARQPKQWKYQFE